MSRYRLEYAINEKIRFLSHRELMTSLQRSLRRASFPFAYSHGFNQRPKFSFGPPLGVGIAGLREYLDVELVEEIAQEEYLQRLQQQLPLGIEAHRLVLVPPGDAGLGKFINCACYQVLVPDSLGISWDKLLQDLEEGDPWWYERPNDDKVFNMSAGIIKSRFQQDEGDLYLEFLLKIGPGEVPVRGLLDVLSSKANAASLPPFRTIRTGLYRQENNCFISPMGEIEVIFEG